MERVPAKDSPHLPGNSMASLIQPSDPSLLTPNRLEFDAEHPPWYSLPPSTVDFQYTQKSRFKLPRLKPLFQGFEPPSFSHIVILTFLCLITYPAFFALTFAAKDRSLFVVRSIVSAWCWVIGFALGYILLRIGARHIEAASKSMPVWNREYLIFYFKQPGPR